MSFFIHKEVQNNKTQKNDRQNDRKINIQLITEHITIFQNTEIWQFYVMGLIL